MAKRYINAGRSALISGIVLTVTTLGTITSSANVVRNAEDFSAFWQNFRAASLKKDWAALARMTTFPLTTKGVLDRDPVHHVSRREFTKVFGTFLAEEAFPEGSQLEFIRRTTHATHPPDSNAEVVRVGDMVFRRIKGNWRLDTLFMQYTS